MAADRDHEPMAHGDTSAEGETFLLAAVDAAEALVAPWREPPGRGEVPAHITVHGPFLPTERLDGRALDDLADLFAAHPAFTVRFDGCGRFPGVLYLAPTPAEPLRELTEAVTAHWRIPPYGGEFPDTVPHLTVGPGLAPARFDEAEAALGARLPLVARITVITLYARRGGRWRPETEFPLRHSAQ
jgi:2'-5' RNA ligase